MKAMIVDGKVAKDYWVDFDGVSWSTKSGVFKKLSFFITEKYPKTVIRIDNKDKNIYAHRVVCETLHPFPIPEGIPLKDWKRTPVIVRDLLKRQFQVNHIDHDHKNYHPSNLEWVSTKANSRKYQNHRKNNGK
jgi:hypothetical protein